MKLKLAALLLCLGLPAFAETDVDCLGKAIYNEAKGEDLLGQLLVAKVVMNRVDHKGFPDTICEVVNQPNQFNTKSTTNWEALATAELVLQGEFVLPKISALYFHSGPKPAYLKKKQFLLQHGGHYFYY